MTSVLWMGEAKSVQVRTQITNYQSLLVTQSWIVAADAIFNEKMLEEQAKVSHVVIL